MHIFFTLSMYIYIYIFTILLYIYIFVNRHSEYSSTANPSAVQSALRCDDAHGTHFASVDAVDVRFVEAKCSGKMFGWAEPLKIPLLKFCQWVNHELIKGDILLYNLFWLMMFTVFFAP